VSESLHRLVFADALALLLEREYVFPVITNYELARLVFRLLQAGEVGGRRLRARPRIAMRSDLYAARDGLLKRGTFKEDKALPNTVHRIVDRTRSDPESVLSAVDPFGFLSHLSAMAFHGLTNRLPKVIFFTTLDASAWQSAAQEKMRKDFGDQLNLYKEQELPPLRRIQLERTQGLTISYVRTSSQGGYRLANEGTLRVATLGKTFLDMLRRPDLCGGISHVLEIYESRGREHASLIINEFEQRGAPIDRVRAGYILEERCGVTDPRLDAWIADAQRGGSRKLDPKGEYAPRFSERWQLSINA
jgi:predicted transcriptional regulator of viral defense system